MLTKKLAPCLKRFSIFQLTKCHQKTSVFTKCPRDPQKWTIAPGPRIVNNLSFSIINGKKFAPGGANPGGGARGVRPHLILIDCVFLKFRLVSECFEIRLRWNESI